MIGLIPTMSSRGGIPMSRLATARAILRRPLSAAVTVVVAATSLVFLSASAPADATPRPYLALGDSVVFGYITADGFAYRNADNFVGYPDYVSRTLHLTDVNAACPGEATGGFLSSTGADNGCRPFRENFPLHVSYAGTQEQFAATVAREHAANARIVKDANIKIE